jgi:hypothetical protein
VPSMLGSDGPWHGFAHACAVAGSYNVFLAGVYVPAPKASMMNAVGMMDLPMLPSSFTPSPPRAQLLPYTLIIIFSCAALAHAINFGLVLLFMQRSYGTCSLSHKFGWALAAMFLSGFWFCIFPRQCAFASIVRHPSR